LIDADENTDLKLENRNVRLDRLIEIEIRIRNKR